MRRLDIIILLLLLLAPACNRIGGDGGMSADRDGKMRVELLLPGMYGGGISTSSQQAASSPSSPVGHWARPPTQAPAKSRDP